MKNRDIKDKRKTQIQKTKERHRYKRQMKNRDIKDKRKTQI